jgi:hypothetical protein
LIARLYEVEREARELEPEARELLRQSRAKPVADALHAWLWSKHRTLGKADITHHRVANCLSVMTGECIFFSKTDDPMTTLFAIEAKPYGVRSAANCCSLCPSAIASANNWFQSSGG